MSGAAALTVLDWLIVAVSLLSVIIGGVRGLFRELLSLVIWVAALIMASLFASTVSELLEPLIESETVRYPLAYGGLFVAMLIVGALLQKLLGALVDATGLTGLDRLLGTLFGVARAVVLWVVLVVVLEPLFAEAGWWQDSVLVPHLLALQEDILEFLRQLVATVAAVVRS